MKSNMSNSMTTTTMTITYLVALTALVALSATLEPARADDKLKDLIKSKGYVELKVIEAKVPDLDSLPGQGDSDVFVRVFLNDTKEVMCETKIIQDKNDPQFDKECRSKAVPADTVLRFELYDSDKPAPEPDWIGLSKVKLVDVIFNRNLDRDLSYPIEGRQFPKYFVKAKINFTPEK